MKIQINRYLVLAIGLLLGVLGGFSNSVFGQINSVSNETITKSAILQKVSPAAVLILTGKGDSVLDNVGSGLIIKDTGVILTAYHLIKDANRVQVRLSTGEIYDKVDLLAIDERRDVAAIKISGANLPTAILGKNEPIVDSKIFVVNPKEETWAIADGTLKSIRLPNEVANNGNGFKSLQFSAWVLNRSKGGLLADEYGNVIGIIVASLDSGQNINIAIPLASVFGLSDGSEKIMSFEKGSSLELPQIVRPYGAGDILDANPKSILKNARIIYVSGWSELVSSAMMENALRKRPEFAKWNLIIVDSKSELADILINVEHDLFTFDYRFKVTDRRTTIILQTGKVTAWDGKTAVEKFAKMIIAEMKKEREPEIKTVKTK